MESSHHNHHTNDGHGISNDRLARIEEDERDGDYFVRGHDMVVDDRRIAAAIVDDDSLLLSGVFVPALVVHDDHRRPREDERHKSMATTTSSSPDDDDDGVRSRSGGLGDVRGRVDRIVVVVVVPPRLLEGGRRRRQAAVQRVPAPVFVVFVVVVGGIGPSAGDVSFVPFCFSFPCRMHYGEVRPFSLCAGIIPRLLYLVHFLILSSQRHSFRIHFATKPMMYKTEKKIPPRTPW